MRRRDFIRQSAAGAAGAAAGISLPTQAQPTGGDPSVKWSKAPCRFCGTGCGVTVAVKDNRVIATAHASLSMAGAFFQQHGITPMILGDSVTGEAREVAKVYAALAKQIQQYHHPLKPPVALISGGECTVTIRPDAETPGRGGRCSEFLLSLAVELEGRENIHALACDTDGIDGSEDNAGAYLAPNSLSRAAAAGLSAKRLLQANDAYGFFAPLGDLVVTGPTRTNVNDYRVILVI